MSPLRWTSKSTRTLARALSADGHRVSDFVVRRLLRELGYSLQANAKTTEGGQHPDRDTQFAYLADQAQAHLDASNPVISVDTKKRELVGAYKNGGREWSPAGEPVKVKVHDFIDPALGKANPYGVYDVGADTGWVSVGTDHDTAQFAVATIARWWTAVGAPSYPGATGLPATPRHARHRRPKIFASPNRRAGCRLPHPHTRRRTARPQTGPPRPQADRRRRGAAPARRPLPGRARRPTGTATTGYRRRTPSPQPHRPPRQPRGPAPGTHPRQPAAPVTGR